MPVKIGDLELYDVAELSELLDVQKRTIRNYLRDGKLRGRKMARKWYVTLGSLEAFFQGGDEPEEQPALEGLQEE